MANFQFVRFIFGVLAFFSTRLASHGFEYKRARTVKKNNTKSKKGETKIWNFVDIQRISSVDSLALLPVTTLLFRQSWLSFWFVALFFYQADFLFSTFCTFIEKAMVLGCGDGPSEIAAVKKCLRVSHGIIYITSIIYAALWNERGFVSLFSNDRQLTNLSSDILVTGFASMNAQSHGHVQSAPRTGYNRHIHSYAKKNNKWSRPPTLCLHIFCHFSSSAFGIAYIPCWRIERKDPEVNAKSDDRGFRSRNVIEKKRNHILFDISARRDSHWLYQQQPIHRDARTKLRQDSPRIILAPLRN